MTVEETAQFMGALIAATIAATIAGFVAADARRRGMPTKAVVGWGVFCALILFLPLYLWLRSKTPGQNASLKTAASNGLKPCPYCEYSNAANASFCGKCGRQFKSSTEIHRP